MKTILLVAPTFEYLRPSDNTQTQLVESFIKEKKSFMAPLALATVAALTPDDIEVDLWDERIHGGIDEDTKFARDYDLVGITGYSSQIGQVKAIARVFHSRGVTVAIGGPGVSSTPELYVNLADILFVGEAELIWPQFIKDWKAGAHRRIYRQINKLDVAVSPTPRWDLLNGQMSKYLLGAIQTTRGCPFDCEFCDVSYILGRQPRSKPIEHVLEEVRLLQKLGLQNIFFCDDNFIGNPGYAKGLLEALVPLNNSFPSPVKFFTQLSLNLARHEDLLELLADANFAELFIGIETPNKESLKETNKLQNYNTNILADIHKIQSYGLPITAGIIVGFDHDTPEIFDQQFEFLQESCMPKPRIHLLCAPKGTRLWQRLQKEGRILVGDDDPIMPRTVTNIIPAGMTRLELFQGYLSLHERIRNWDNLTARVKGFISGVRRQPKVKQGQQEHDPEQIRNFFFSLDGEIRSSVFNIFQYTREHAPYLLGRVMGLVLMELRQTNLLERVRTNIQKQVELESSENFKPELVRFAVGVPENFNEYYKNLFPDIYNRVCQSIIDKSRVEEVLIEIFTDFLVRCGSESVRFEDWHSNELYEICASSIARENSTIINSTQDVDEKTPVIKSVADIRKSKLADDILHAVEQDLRLYYAHEIGFSVPVQQATG